MDPLFPALPEDITAMSDEELASLRSEHESAKELILNEDEEFLKGLDANEILAQLETGGNQYQLLLAEQDARGKAHEAYQETKAEKLKAFDPKEEDEEEGSEEEASEEVEVVAEVEEVEEVSEEEPVLVTASAASANSVRLVGGAVTPALASRLDRPASSETSTCARLPTRPGSTWL